MSVAHKFTPGPWEYDCGIIPPDGPGRYSDIYVDGGDKVIASVNEFWTTSRQEGEANARLIAAAPELLEALKLVMSWIDNWTPEFTYDTEWSKDRDKARAAIKKAEGAPS